MVKPYTKLRKSPEEILILAKKNLIDYPNGALSCGVREYAESIEHCPSQDPDEQHLYAMYCAVNKVRKITFNVVKSKSNRRNYEQ